MGSDMVNTLTFIEARDIPGGTSKLSRKDVDKILNFYNVGKHTQKELSVMFGVKQPQISRIVNKRSWQYD